jgi:hypothetical protein
MQIMATASAPKSSTTNECGPTDLTIGLSMGCRAVQYSKVPIGSYQSSRSKTHTMVRVQSIASAVKSRLVQQNSRVLYDGVWSQKAEDKHSQGGVEMRLLCHKQGFCALRFATLTVRPSQVHTPCPCHSAFRSHTFLDHPAAAAALPGCCRA